MSASNEPATKQDLADAVRQVTDKLTEAIRDSQTDVLRGFYDWTRPVDARLRHADDLVQRMGWLEERISNLERELRGDVQFAL